jgi:DNA polymerase III alpha subunit (gram-positive type)
MVSDKPAIDTVIRRFAEFIGDYTLLGHNIKASDLYYINRAAKKSGVRIENAYFDTYRYARKLKDRHGWSKTTLGYLAEQFSVMLSDAHRAWCDAEATAAVYFKLKGIGADF